MTILTNHIKFNRIIFRDVTYTSDYMEKAVDEAAKWLDANIRSNSRIVYLHAPNHIKTIVAFLAVAKTGRATLLVDPKTGKLEYEEMLADTRPGAIIKVDPATIAFDFGKEVELTDYEMTREEIGQLEDVCILLYTAGYEGYMKAAMLTHKNILSNAKAICDCGVGEDAVSCALIPFNHLFSFQTGVLAPGYSKGTILIEELKLINIQKKINSINNHNVSYFYSTPFIYYLISKSLKTKNYFSRIIHFISGGSKLPVSLFKKYHEQIGISLQEGYGLTEASPICTCHQNNDIIIPSSVGRAFSGCKILIRNEQGEGLKPNEIGDIYIQGSNVFKGYFNNAIASKNAVKNGALFTGDIGYLNNEGYLFLTGCKKNQINQAGKKVYPEFIKRLIIKNELISKVEIYTQTKNDYLSLINANIELTPNYSKSDDSIIKWCRNNISKDVNFNIVN